jgi:hypothetical protein
MKLGANILNKISANLIQKSIKKVIHHDQVSFFLEIWEWFNILESLNVIQHINRSRDKNNMIISIGTEKSFHKIHHPFIKKDVMKLRIEDMFRNIIKAVYGSL